jgi:hypothetical protein
MKILVLIPLLFLLAGCSLFPKKVEYFQDKVHSMPAPSESHKEVQKEAADFVARKTKQTVLAAVGENSSTNVLKPAIEAEVVADSLSGSVGKPVEPWQKSANELAAKLDKLDAKLDQKLEDFRKDNDENAGKKIEGTGLIQMGYFTHLLVLGVIVVGGWIIIKVLGVLNPSVGIGTKVISGGVTGVTKLVSRGFSEVVQAGESFKKRVDEEFEDAETKEKIKALFTQAHKEHQSADVQKAIKELTN